MKRLGRWCGRNRPVASLLAVVAVLLVVGTVVSSVLAAKLWPRRHWRRCSDCGQTRMPKGWGF